MARGMRWISLAAVLCLLATGGATAQMPTGSMTGTVMDPTGLPVAGAEVSIIHEASGHITQKTMTTEQGSFLIPSLIAGIYRVEVTAAGFKTGVVSGVKVDPASQRSVPPITLQLGEIAEKVVVEAAATTVQTSSATLTDTVDRRQIDGLPLLNRNPLALLGLQAGVVQGTFARTVTVISGHRPSLSGVTLDGINIQDNFIRSNSLDFLPNLPLLSQVSEFTITTQNAGADAPLGASHVSLVTPAGSNDWRAEGFWYHRNNALAANTWFNNANNIRRPFLLQNQFGGNVGGPIFVNKLFVYGYYEGFRQRQQGSQQHTILTNSARQGLFTYIPTCTTACPVGVTPGQKRTFDVLSQRLNAAGATIGPFPIDSVISTRYLSRVPDQSVINNFDVGDSRSATDLFNTAGFRFNKRANRTRDNWGLRVDYPLSAKHTITSTWSWNRDIVDRNDLDGTYRLAPIVENNDNKKLLSATWRWNPSSRWTNELRGGFNLAPASFLSHEDFSSGRIFAGFNFTNPEVTFRAQGRSTNTWQLMDNASYQRGSHLIRFGFYGQKIRISAYNDAGITQTYNIGLSAANTNGLIGGNFPGGITSSDLGRANSLFSTLSGFITSSSRRFNISGRDSGFVPDISSVRRPRLWNLAWYVADSWRLRSNLTVDIGLRHEYLGRLYDRDGLYIQPVTPSGATNLDVLMSNVTFDFAGGPSGVPLYRADWNNLAPNIGIAWDPKGDGKMAIRAGYSIHFVNDEAIRSPENAALGNTGLNITPSLVNLVVRAAEALPVITPPPFKVPRTAADNRLPAAQGGVGVPDTIWLIDPNLRTPYVQEWNFSVQKMLPWRTAVEVRYVGNKGTKLLRGIDFNQVLIGSPTNPNSFISDFLRARVNGFRNLAVTGTFDPRCNFAGCQPLTVLTQAGSAGLLTNATVRSAIQTGQVGELASVYHFNNLTGALTLVPNPIAGVADVVWNFSNSVYHAGIVEVRRRFSRGLGFQGNYTWSKVLTDASGEGQTKFEPFLHLADPRKDRARATFDITHAFKANFVYELPFGPGRRWAPSNVVLSKLVSGWAASSIFVIQSGSPFSFLSGRGTLNRGGRSGSNTANSSLTLGEIKSLLGVYKRPGSVYIIDPKVIHPTTGRGVGDDAAVCNFSSYQGQIFCNPEPGDLGYLEKLAFNGPKVFSWDFSTYKQTNITERLKFEYRAEFFNVLNHPVFFTGDQSINSVNFGKMTSVAVGRRVIQMTVRFLW